MPWRGSETSVEIDVGTGRSQRTALRTALLKAVTVATGGPWRVRLRGALVYPPGAGQTGEWWWKLTLVSGSGLSRAFMIAPNQQEPGLVATIVRRARAGHFRVAQCGACRRFLGGKDGAAGLIPASVVELCPRCSLRRPSHGLLASMPQVARPGRSDPR